MAMAGPAVRPAVLFSTTDTQGKTAAEDDRRLLPGLINPAGPWPPSSDPPTTSSSGELMFSRDWLCCLAKAKTAQKQLSMPLVLDENGPLFMTLTSPVLTNQTACHVALGRRNKGPLGRDSAAKDQRVGRVLCAQLTGISATIAYYEHQQQHRGDGCKEHPAYGCSNHRWVHIVAGFGCNTSQSHVAARSGSETAGLSSRQQL